MVATNGAMRPPPLPLRDFDGDGNRPRSEKDKDKNIRQTFSCAECKRLKLKCSRVWPCASCEKRGCAQICPNGEMRTGKGKRLILADTEELHHRISLLEVALAQSHAKHTANPHPLLTSPYLFSPRESSAAVVSRLKAEHGLAMMQTEDDLVEGAFGTLTIGQEGEAIFVGSFAGSEYLGEGDEDGIGRKTFGGNIQDGPLTPPSTIREHWTGRSDVGDFGLGNSDLVKAFIPGGTGIRQDVQALRADLPDWEEEGKILCESYWENVNWMYQILPRPMFDKDHLMNAYDPESPANAHKLACVFLVMAVGAMFDLNRVPFDSRGDELFALGRACLGTVDLEHGSPATVQALHLCGTYVLNDKRGNGAEVFWTLLGSAVKVAQSLGLHRDGETFGLSPYEVKERRQVWWELVTYDRLQALCFGRPCATTNWAADTKFPEVDDLLIIDKDGYHRAKYQLIVLFEKVIRIQTQTSPVSIQQVVQVDKEIREFQNSVPDLLLLKTPIQSLPLDRSLHPHLVIHRLGLRLLVAQTRLLLNRPSFALALRDSPEDPSRGKFGESFMALFESAQEIVQLVKTLVIYHPSLIARWWFFWFHAFTSAVCLAAVTIRAPNSAFASPCFHGMSIVVDISAAARPGCRAKKGLPILVRLRNRASEALVAATKSHRRASSRSRDEGREEDDLSHLVGNAKLVRVRGRPMSKKASLRSPDSESSGGKGVPATTSPHRPPSHGDTSPRSTRSLATSATLTEPLYYDPMAYLGLNTPFNEDGIVPRPPAQLNVPVAGLSNWPMTSGPVAPIHQRTASQVSMPLRTPGQSFDTGDQSDQNGAWFGLSPPSDPVIDSSRAPVDATGLGPSPEPSRSTLPQSFMNEAIWTSEWSDMSLSGLEGVHGDLGDLDMDMSMAFGFDKGFGGRDDGYSCDIALGGLDAGDFDLEMFINQLGGSEQGLEV